MKQPSLKAFVVETRKFHERAEIGHECVSFGNTSQVLSIWDVLLLPSIGHVDSRGTPVYLGDVLRITDATGSAEYVVGPLPENGKVVEKFQLEGWRRIKAKQVSNLSEMAEATAEQVASMTVVGNLYRDYQKYVPASTHYCYQGLGLQSSPAGQPRLKTLPCPFWTNSDHGMVYCRLLQIGSLQQGEQAEGLALAHFGGDPDVLGDHYESLLLWDQVKECGINKRR